MFYRWCVQRDKTVLRQMVHGTIKKKVRRRGSKGKGRVPRQYFERTSAVRLLIHSLETRCFRRVLQWVIARGSAILNLQVPLNLDAFITLNALKKWISQYVFISQVRYINEKILCSLVKCNLIVNENTVRLIDRIFYSRKYSIKPNKWVIRV